jgi:ketosteroid isomerase-like protein
MPANLPKPISSFFEAKNAHDVDGALAAFADDASVRNEGQDMTGLGAIRGWIDATTRKYRDVASPIGVRRDGEQTIVTASVSGTFPGNPVELRYRFTLAGEKIAALAID